MPEKRERIWELDALRGFCILCVIFIHFMFDLGFFFGKELHFPPLYTFIQQYGGAIFVRLSGCCATLGSQSFRRGALVFACGMLITLVTWGMYLLHMAGADVVVKFGVLHLLGICMMLYPLFKKLPTAAICAVSAVCIVVGYLLQGMVFEVRWLFPLGVLYPGFTSSDYFPVFPQLGWFLLGVVLGRTFYREKRTLLPGRAQDFFLLRFFRWCGRHSLWIYLLHQPLVYGVLELIAALKK